MKYFYAIISSMGEQLQKAVEVFNQGGIVIFPTDTAFGIGCRIDREDSIQRLFTLRRRPEDKAVPVLASSIFMVKEYVKEFGNEVQELIETYWPGALTIVLPCNTQRVPNLVRGGGRTIGVRMPNHQDVLSVIAQIGVPILGPSANFAGEQTPYSVADLDKNLVQNVDFVLQGECSVKHASTVLDCSISPWKIVREGAVNIAIDFKSKS